MDRLSMKELSCIEDEIRAEEITAKTMNWCASMCQDIEQRDQLERLAETHQLNVAHLSQYFNRSKHIQ